MARLLCRKGKGREFLPQLFFLNHLQVKIIFGPKSFMGGRWVVPILF